MPYSAAHKQQTRTRIIESARRLFNRNGFEAVTIGEIMKDAGLTHGGFYKHFAAKEDLYQAAVLQFICTDTPPRWQRRNIDPSAAGEGIVRTIVDAYLSDDHLRDVGGSCPMIALPSDAARGSDSVKDAFRQVMEMMVGVFAEHLEPCEDGQPARERALALVAMVVGGMVLARSVGDRKLAAEIRRSTRRQVYAAAGWQR
jgi:AcrR family transcriptional regulator